MRLEVAVHRGAACALFMGFTSTFIPPQPLFAANNRFDGADDSLTACINRDVLKAGRRIRRVFPSLPDVEIW